MRLIKMFSLAAIAAVAAMAFVGATSASAAFSTALCKTHTSLTCAEGDQVKSIHMVLSSGGPYGGVGKLLNSTADVLCLTVLAEASVGALAAPGAGQKITASTFTIAGCGTGTSHTNCAVTAEELPTLDLLKTGLDTGVLSALNGTTRVKCTIFGFIKIDCLYDGSGLEFEVEGGGKGMLTAEESPASLKSGGGLCPETSSLDGLLEALEEIHIIS